MPTDSALIQDIHDALDQSRFLIVICSQNLLQSNYCTDEINYFKQRHGGQTTNILIVLADSIENTNTESEKERCTLLLSKVLGLPMVEMPLPEPGQTRTVLENEPNFTDLRATSLRKQLRILDSEYLRLAAPLLQCDYADLNRWHLRRRITRIALIASSIVLAATATTIVISILARRAIEAEQQMSEAYASELFTKSESAERIDGNLHAALYYAASAVSIDSETKPDAELRAMLLMQNNPWCLPSESVDGQLIDGHAVVASAEENCAFDTIPSPTLSEGETVTAVLKDAYVIQTYGGFDILSFTGERSALSLPSMTDLKVCDGENVCLFSDEEGRFYVYRRDTDAVYTIAMGDVDMAKLAYGAFQYASAKQGDRIFAAFLDHVTVYDFDGQNYQISKQLEVSVNTPTDISTKDTSAGEDALTLTASSDGQILSVNDTFGFVLYAVNTGGSLMRIEGGLGANDIIQQICISPNNQFVAVAYGVHSTDTGQYPKGKLVVFSVLDLGNRFSSEDAGGEHKPFVSCAFHDNSRQLAACDSDGTVHLYAFQDGKWNDSGLLLRSENAVTGMCFAKDDGTLIVEQGHRQLNQYSYLLPTTQAASFPLTKGIPLCLSVDEGGYVVFSTTAAFRLAADGALLQKANKNTKAYAALVDTCKQNTDFAQNVSSVVDQTVSRDKIQSYPLADGGSISYQQGRVVSVSDTQGHEVARKQIPYLVDDVLYVEALHALVLNTHEIVSFSRDNRTLENVRLVMYAYSDGALQERIMPLEFQFVPKDFWVYGHRLVTSDGRGELLICDLTTAEMVRLSRSNAATVVQASDIIGDWIALEVEEYQPDQLSGDKWVELWNVNSGVLLFRDGGPGTLIGGIALYENALYYVANDVVKRLELSYQQNADMNTFLLGLSGYTFDQNHRLTLRQSSAVLPMGRQLGLDIHESYSQQE